MPYDRAADLVRLAIRLQGTWSGLTLDDIQREFEVSRRTAERLRALLEAEALDGIEPGVQALTEAEGLAMRPGPRPRLDEGLLALLRHAITVRRVVRFDYATRATGRTRRRVAPYGLIYGNRAFLVGRAEPRLQATERRPLIRPSSEAIRWPHNACARDRRPQDPVQSGRHSTSADAADGSIYNPATWSRTRRRSCAPAMKWSLPAATAASRRRSAGGGLPETRAASRRLPARRRWLVGRG